MSRKNQHGYMKRCGLRNRKEVTKMKLASAIIAEESKGLKLRRARYKRIKPMMEDVL